ncbi:hypothetical protein F5884DRAFT_879992, partial [Xylogone sp. PMI_703]
MATLLAPYNSAMQLGTGFNSFTQQLCINNAVISVRDGPRETPRQIPETDGKHEKLLERKNEIAQDVSYKASVVDKVTDITSSMNVNAAFGIKYDAWDAAGKVDFLNTSKVKESDISFLFSVKVVNQVIYDHSLTEIVPIATSEDGILDGKTFADIYGDCFISGFQEGGTFTAVISVKAKTEDKARKIKANADIFFTKPKSPESEKSNGKSKNAIDFHLGLNNLNDGFLKENETTISVSYSGGGQHLKHPNEDWTFETMKNAALQFPKLVAQTPMRTHAILTKYTALRSYHNLYANLKLPAFEVAAVYASILQEAYLDYKTVAGNLQVLGFEVSAGKMKLLSASEYRKQIEEAKKARLLEAERRKKAIEAIDKTPTTDETNSKPGVDTPNTETSENEKGAGASEVSKTKEIEKDDSKKDDTEEEKEVEQPRGKNEKKNDNEMKLHWKPIKLTKEYAATIQGLEDARSMVRTFLIRIVQEINILTRYPELALEQDRVQPHMSPFLFKELLPIGQPFTPEDEQDKEMGNVLSKVDEMKAQKHQAKSF